jgi:hypothetical protein
MSVLLSNPQSQFFPKCEELGLIYSICYGNKGVSSSVCDADRYVIIRKLLDSILSKHPLFIRIHRNISSVMLPAWVVTYTGSWSI